MTLAKLMFTGVFVLQCTALKAAGDAPESVAKAYQQFLIDGNPDKAAALVVPDDIEQFHRLMMPLMSAADPSTDPVFAKMFGQGVSKEALLNMSPDEFFRGFITMISSAFTRGENVSVESSQVVGVIHESNKLCHVLLRFRLDARGKKASLMEVLSLQPVGQDWRVTFKEKLEMMELALQPLLRQTEAAERD